MPEAAQHQTRARDEDDGKSDFGANQQLTGLPRECEPT
jgi:hypothetical protein